MSSSEGRITPQTQAFSRRRDDHLNIALGSSSDRYGEDAWGPAALETLSCKTRNPTESFTHDAPNGNKAHTSLSSIFPSFLNSFNPNAKGQLLRRWNLPKENSASGRVLSTTAASEGHNPKILKPCIHQVKLFVLTYRPCSFVSIETNLPNSDPPTSTRPPFSYLKP